MTAHTLPPASPAQTLPGPFTNPLPTLGEVRSWLYLLDTDLEEDVLAAIETSAYDLVVLDFIPSQEGSSDFPMAGAIDRLHRAAHPKIVLAYLDIGQAEDFRVYWQRGWGPGDPEWILAEDPEGWPGDFPVAYWSEEWRALWLTDGALIQQVVEAGFDGAYLDWVEGYDDEAVIAAAVRDGVDPRLEMIRWVRDLAAEARAGRAGFLIIAQNAADLLGEDSYASTIDGIAQEQIWFDGGPDDDPPGDCPLPRTEAEVDSEEYVGRLSPACRRLYEENPDGTLHTSSEEYLRLLLPASGLGLPVFTVDYSVEETNIAWVYAEARRLGWIPFVTNRALDRIPLMP